MTERVYEQLTGKLAYLQSEREHVQEVLGNQYLSYKKMLEYAVRDVKSKLTEEDERAA